jgi:hypothetical protein
VRVREALADDGRRRRAVLEEISAEQLTEVHCPAGILYAARRCQEGGGEGVEARPGDAVRVSRWQRGKLAVEVIGASFLERHGELVLCACATRSAAAWADGCWLAKISVGVEVLGCEVRVERRV